MSYTVEKTCLGCQKQILETKKYCTRECYFKNRTGDRNPNWKGGKHYRQDGYILIRIGTQKRTAKGKRYDLEHRIVMEEHLGRALMPEEVVHHINGDKTDNRIENLEILESQAVHAKKHDCEREKNNLGQYV